MSSLESNGMSLYSMRKSDAETRKSGAETRKSGAETRKSGAEKRKSGVKKRNCTLGPPYTYTYAPPPPILPHLKYHRLLLQN